jgi:acyl carrier protein
MSTSTILADYITKELAKGRATTIRPEDDLLSAGIIDSLGILQLVSFVEKQFGIQIPDEDVVLENFQSVAALSAYLDKQRAA